MEKKKKRKKGKKRRDQLRRVEEEEEQQEQRDDKGTRGGRGVAAEAVAGERKRANYRCTNERWAGHFFRTVFGYCSSY